MIQELGVWVEVLDQDLGSMFCSLLHIVAIIQPSSS